MFIESRGDSFGQLCPASGQQLDVMLQNMVNFNNMKVNKFESKYLQSLSPAYNPSSASPFLAPLVPSAPPGSIPSDSPGGGPSPPGLPPDLPLVLLLQQPCRGHYSHQWGLVELCFTVH